MPGQLLDCLHFCSVELPARPSCSPGPLSCCRAVLLLDAGPAGARACAVVTGRKPNRALCRAARFGRQSGALARIYCHQPGLFRTLFLPHDTRTGTGAGEIEPKHMSLMSPACVFWSSAHFGPPPQDCTRATTIGTTSRFESSTRADSSAVEMHELAGCVRGHSRANQHPPG